MIIYILIIKLAALTTKNIVKERSSFLSLMRRCKQRIKGSNYIHLNNFYQLCDVVKPYRYDAL